MRQYLAPLYNALATPSLEEWSAFSSHRVLHRFFPHLFYLPRPVAPVPVPVPVPCQVLRLQLTGRSVDDLVSQIRDRVEEITERQRDREIQQMYMGDAAQLYTPAMAKKVRARMRMSACLSVFACVDVCCVRVCVCVCACVCGCCVGVAWVTGPLSLAVSLPHLVAPARAPSLLGVQPAEKRQEVTWTANRGVFLWLDRGGAGGREAVAGGLSRGRGSGRGGGGKKRVCDSVGMATPDVAAVAPAGWIFVWTS